MLSSTFPVFYCAQDFFYDLIYSQIAELKILNDFFNFFHNKKKDSMHSKVKVQRYFPNVTQRDIQECSRTGRTYIVHRALCCFSRRLKNVNTRRDSNIRRDLSTIVRRFKIFELQKAK